MAQINATRYGLTLGLHTRIDETIGEVVSHARVGNVYVNRNMVGAVVGVQPFGGEGLSGTGPKAGGPLYMYRLLAARPDDILARAADCGLPGSLSQGEAQAMLPAFAALNAWVVEHRSPTLAAQCRDLARRVGDRRARLLIGPTGERNVYSLRPREAVLCLAQSEDVLLLQLAGALAVGSPHARGVSYGRQARELINLSLSTYFSAWNVSEASAKDVLARSRIRIWCSFYNAHIARCISC